MLTKSLANELWQRQIDVNLLVPGPVATTTLSRQDPNSVISAEEILQNYREKPPAGLPAWERVKHPDEVADLALQMANYAIGGPTGQTFHWRDDHCRWRPLHKKDRDGFGEGNAGC